MEQQKDVVLVTGAYGLVGMALQKVIKFTNFKSCTFVFLSRVVCDLRDYQQVCETFQIYKPTIVIHLASHVGGVYDNMNNNFKYLMDNVQINSNIVRVCNQTNVKKLINMLSTCIFPDQGVSYPLTSDQLHNGLPHFSNIGYSYSKRFLQVASSLMTSDCKVVNIIPTNLYGECDNYNIVSGHVIPALIHKMYKAKTNGEPLLVRGSGSAVRQFLFAEDLAHIVLHFVTNENIQKEVTCIASPPEESEISIKDLVSCIAQELGFSGNIVYESENTHLDGQQKKTTNDSELKKFMPAFQFTPLKDGLKATICFFTEHYSIVRK